MTARQAGGSWAEARARHSAFWRRDEAHEPIVGDKRTDAFLLGGFPLPEDDRPILPEDIDVEAAVEWAEGLFHAGGAGEGGGFLDGDLVWGAPPVPGIPWSEAIMGCPIHYSRESGSLWAESWLDDWDRMESVLPLSENRWYGKLVEITRAFVRASAGRYPVTQTVTRCPSEVMTAMRGYERLCLDFFDSPDQVERLAAFCTDVWIEAASSLFEILPPFDGGYPAPRLEVWAPGRLVRMEEDAVILFSPETYRRFFREPDRRIAAAFEYSLFHTHSGDTKIVSELVGIEELSGIQVSIDPSGPHYTELIPMLRGVQEAGKALLVTHELPDEDVQVIAGSLSPDGLALERMRSV